jgi:NDP-sugar pyrophosphorylase family protein
MQALILAGGKGTRLKPYTTVLPKPLMPVGDYPILEIILRQLKDAGINEVILAVGHMSQLFESFFQDGSRYGLKITYSFEDHQLGTAGPIALAIDQLNDDFLVMNGDLLTTLNYYDLFYFHKKMKAVATIALSTREVKIDFGVIETGSDNKLSRYIEKPVYKFDVSMGINVMNKKAIMPYLKAGEYAVYCYREPCYWLDIGRIDDYQTATEILESRISEFLPDV